MKPRIFVSTVTSEFKTARTKIEHVLEFLGYEVVQQDIFGTEGGDLRQMLREKIDSCDALIQLAGDAYGAEPPTVDPDYGRVSYTQFEFLYARLQGKKTYVLFAGPACHKDTALPLLDLPRQPNHPDPTAHQAELRDLQSAYRARLRSEGHLWHSPADDTALENAILKLRADSEELRKEFRDWQKNLAATLGRIEDKLHLRKVQPAAPHPTPHLLPPAALQYFGRTKERDELTALLRARQDACVLGLAGMGKTALAAVVLTHLFGSQPNELSKQLFPHGIVFLDLYLLKADSEKVWSALANALAGTDYEKDLPSRTRAERACANCDFLLIIEGAEEAHGKEPSATLADLLEVLCPQNRTLILTRDRDQATPANTVEIKEALAPEDAAALLDFHAKQAPIPDSIRTALLTNLEGHPLAITWAGSLIGQRSEEAAELLEKWNAENLPKINDPKKPHHTLRWLFERNTRNLSPECHQFLRGAGQLARAPFPLTAFQGAPGITDPAACAKALVNAGILRLTAEQGHREFTHVLGYQFATPPTPQTDEALPLHLAHWLEQQLRTALFTPGVDARFPQVTRLLQHSAALISANPSTTTLWFPLANKLVYNFQDRLITIGRLDLAKASIFAAADWLNTLPSSTSKEPNWQREVAGCHSFFGNLALAQGDLPAAAKAYTAAMEIAKALAARAPENTERQRDLSVIYIKLGEISVAQGDFPAAAKTCTAAMEIIKALAAREPESNHWRRDLFVSYIKLGEIAMAQGDLPAAAKAYTAAKEITKVLVARNPENTEWLRDLSISHSNLGDIAVAQGDLPAAAKAYTAAMEITEALAAHDPENTNWQRDLFISYNNLGKIAIAQGDLPAADKTYTAAIEITKALAARDPENTRWQRDLYVSHIKLAQLAAKQSDEGEARAHFQQSHDILQALVDQGKHVSPADMDVLAELKQYLGLE